MDHIPEDIMELDEMLDFLRQWLSGADIDLLAASFRRFVSSDRS